MNILERIIEVKKREVLENKKRVPVVELKKKEFYNRPSISVVNRLRDPQLSGIITEFKRASPSKGIINGTARVEDVVQGYAANKAVAISVLTDRDFFQGSLEDLLMARKAVPDIPLLRKDFIIDEYQIVEAKAYGADLILLIAACLSPSEVQRLSGFAKGEGLEVLLEIHTEEELGHIGEDIDIVGVNNRNLKTFEVDIQHSIELLKKIPAKKARISESGIYSMDTVRMLKDGGFEGFLVGENFMKEKDPAEAFRKFIGDNN